MAATFRDQRQGLSARQGPLDFDLFAETERALTSRQAVEIARRAHERKPTRANRVRLINALWAEDDYLDIERLFGHAEDHSYEELLILAFAALSHEHPAADQRAAALADRAVAASESREQRAAALATRAKAEIRLNALPAARDSLAAALDEDPANKDACKRLAALDLADGRQHDLLTWTGRLIDQGVSHSRLFAAYALAQARAGRIGDVRRTMGIDEFHLIGEPPSPPGWNDLSALNDAVAQELLSHPGMRFDRYGSASSQTWRVENPARGDRPATRALTDAIIGEIRRRVAGLGVTDGPWAAARPARAWLRSWAVITDGDGFENWHVHQFGWLSGVYYVRVPDQIAQGNSKNGCIAFGLPDDLAGEDGARSYGEQVVRPREGMMMTFPSHAYHRTYPHETGGKRICFAFDVRPIS